MAKKTIKARAKIKRGVCTLKALIKHPMETGLRKDKKTGKKIPAHFIQEVKCVHNGDTVMDAYWGGSVSKNPYISFAFTGAKKGEKIAISWTDNTGDSDSIETKIK